MTTELVKKENNVVTLKFKVDAETFEKGLVKAYNKTKKQFNIPGFRKGKAPRKLIEKMYGEGVFYDEAINFVFPDAYENALKEQSVEPVDRANLEDFIVEDGAEFVVSVIVKPEVKLGEYKGVSAEKSVANVEDAQVEEEIKKLQEKNARIIEVEDRDIKENDIVTIDYKGFIGDEAFEGGEAQGHELTIGSKQFIEGFEEQLIGKKAGEDVTVEVSFPEDYHAEDLKGKPARFEVKIHEIKEKELPELDDEFAKDVSEFDTLDELKADTKSTLLKQAENKAEGENKDKVIGQIVEACEIDVPEVMIENQIDMEIRNFEQSLQYQGLNLDTYLMYTGTTREAMREQLKENAEKAVRTDLVLSEIKKVEKIEASEEELEAELTRMAEMYNQELDKFKKTLREEDKAYFQDGLERKKTIEYLMENADLK